MNVEVVILDLTSRGAQVAIGEGAPFWLPRSGPGIEWSAQPEIGDVVFVRVPAWLCAKHQQLQALRYQSAFAYQAPVELNPTKAERPLPMADYLEDAGKGFLARNERREKPSHPEFTGKLRIGNTEYRLAWVKEKDGKRYFSIAANEIEQRPQMPPQRPAGGPTFRDDESISFEMEWR